MYTSEIMDTGNSGVKMLLEIKKNGKFFDMVCKPNERLLIIHND
jgi:hypothetical protein